MIFQINRYPEFTVRTIGLNEIRMFRTDELGKRIVFFVHFQEEVCSPVGFLKVVAVEKEGI